MVQLIKIILVAVWLPQLIDQVLTWEYWIQIKEYRFDRFKVFIYSKEVFKNLNLYSFLVKISSLSILLFFNLNIVFTIVLFLAFDLISVFGVLKGKLRKPVFTQRARRIFLTSIIGILIFALLYFKTNNYNYLLIGELVSIMGLFVGIIWTTIFVKSAIKKDVALAKEKIKEVNPFVIGITGSYGKTTTKEFLGHILSHYAKTTTTIKNENTELGVARMIINKLEKGTKYLVCEMGAYKKGEIKSICEIVQPRIGIITGIEPQHLAIFGSFNNLKNAKFELIDSLHKNDIGIFNYSNDECVKLAKRARSLNKLSRVIGYSLSNNKEADYVAKIKKIFIDKIDFDVYENGKKHSFTVPLSGEHFVENLTGAIAAARTVGVDWNTIYEACKNVTTPEGTMKVIKANTGGLIINDSYNSTPKSFEVALKFIASLKTNPKMVITSGIIELGEYSASVHKNIARQLEKQNVKLTMVTNIDNFNQIKSGLKDKNKIKLINNLNDIKNQIKNIIDAKGLILIEGRVPSYITHYLDSFK